MAASEAPPQSKSNVAPERVGTKTVDWDTLLDDDAIASVLPGPYARFAQPVKEGLAVFLAGLPAARQATILAEQAALPVGATISVRLGRFAHACPVLHKLAQVLARDQRIAPELREQFRKLESLAPTVSPEEIDRTLDEELGVLDHRRVTLAPPALAEASVAVVIPFTETVDGAQRRGVFKVLKPNITERMAEELELLGRVGEHLDERCEALGLPHLDYAETFDQVRDKLRAEVCLDQEQDHLASAALFYQGEPSVHVPAVFREHCTPSVTAMERLFGEKVTDHKPATAAGRRQLAELVSQALVARPAFSTDRRALFHSDPHAGNLMVTREGRLGIIDWSLVGHLGVEHRMAIAQIVLAALTLRGERIVTALEGLARTRADRAALASVVRDHLRRVRRGTPPGMTWAVHLMDDVVQRARMRVAGDLMLFRKSLLTLEGVVAELGAGPTALDNAVAKAFFGCFAWEWLPRWFAPPWSREFGTRLSNVDIAETMLSLPSTAARYWRDEWLDLAIPQGAASLNH